MARSSLVCLCLRFLLTLQVALRQNIRIVSVQNATFGTASVLEHLEESRVSLSSALCRHFSLWFCTVHQPNITAQQTYSDFESGISLSAHREEIDHHVLNPKAPAPWSFTSWAPNPLSTAVEKRSDTISYGWAPKAPVSTFGNATRKQTMPPRHAGLRVSIIVCFTCSCHTYKSHISSPGTQYGQVFQSATNTHF